MNYLNYPYSEGGWISNSNLIMLERARVVMVAVAVDMQKTDPSSEDAGSLLYAAGMLSVDIGDRRERVAKQCEPWFDCTAFAPPAPLYWPLLCTFEDGLGPEAFRRKTA